MAVALLGAGITVHAQTSAKDSMRVVNLQEVQVVSTRATAKTPVAFTNIGKAELKKVNFGQDIPYLLSMTPSTLTTSDAGAGIGYTTLRVRGTDGTRINITVNGIPMNDAESHNLFWVNMPDFSSSVKDMQVQRGAGTSTNGAGAFGASVNMQTEGASMKPYAEFNGSYGSFNTHKETVKVGTGLLNNHWTFDARLSNIGTDGYIDRASVDLYSFYAQGGYFADNTSVKFITFGGKEKTYHAWNYATKEEMKKYGRRFNSCGMYTDDDGHIRFYKDQTDNYLQINNQLILNHRIDDRWVMNATAFYTYGYGYYKQYKDDAWLAGYTNLQSDIEQADLIREKIMRNHLGGINASAAYSVRNLDLTFGGSWSYYSCPHWGTLDWVDGLKKSDIRGRWYDNDVDKQDANVFVRANWTVARGLRLFADMQYRYVHYQAWGVNDNYDEASGGMQPIDVDETYHFFNPRAGVSYSPGKRHNFYFSFAVAQKEPTRSDFTDRYMFSGDDSYPSSEKLYDYELGYNYTSPRFSAGVNLYYMKYKDQLVHTGMVNDSSDALNVNVPDSYRRGIELTASWRVTGWFTAGANATFSQNRIENYVDALSNSPTYGQNLGERTISYSPSAMGSLFLDFHYRGFEAVLHTQAVGKQYFTNDENETLSLGRYCVTNLNLGYTFRTRAARSVRLGLQINNLFNAEYESNGYGYSYMDTWSDPTPRRIDMAYYFAQAPLNVLANVTVKF